MFTLLDRTGTAMYVSYYEKIIHSLGPGSCWAVTWEDGLSIFHATCYPNMAVMVITIPDDVPDDDTEED